MYEKNIWGDLVFMSLFKSFGECVREEEKKYYEFIREDIKNSMGEIKKIKSTELYKAIVEKINKYNKEHFNDCIKWDCLTTSASYLPFYYVGIYSDNLSGRSQFTDGIRVIKYSELGYQNLSQKQCEILGLALIEDGYCVPDSFSATDYNMNIRFKTHPKYIHTKLRINQQFWNQYWEQVKKTNALSTKTKLKKLDV